jgi:hypothetical protein
MGLSECLVNGSAVKLYGTHQSLKQSENSELLAIICFVELKKT